MSIYSVPPCVFLNIGDFLGNFWDFLGKIQSQTLALATKLVGMTFSQMKSLHLLRLFAGIESGAVRPKIGNDLIKVWYSSPYGFVKNKKKIVFFQSSKSLLTGLISSNWNLKIAVRKNPVLFIL